MDMFLPFIFVYELWVYSSSVFVMRSAEQFPVSLGSEPRLRVQPPCLDENWREVYVYKHYTCTVVLREMKLSVFQ